MKSEILSFSHHPPVLQLSVHMCDREAGMSNSTRGCKWNSANRLDGAPLRGSSACKWPCDFTQAVTAMMLQADVVSVEPR